MKILVNHNSAIPFYLQIEEQLRTIIKGEEYKQGKMLPNEIDLSKQLGISRNTLRQAINNLVNEGLLMRKKGSRYSCCKFSCMFQSSELDEFHTGNENFGNCTNEL